MRYKICFTLGDPGGDGHASTSEYHMLSTHSVEDIENAYKKAVELIGFDFVKEVGNDFGAQYHLTEGQTNALLKYKVIDADDDHINRDKSYDGCPLNCYEFDYAEEEFLHIFYKLIKLIIPDFDGKQRDLKEEELGCLYGAAYGFTYHGE